MPWKCLVLKRGCLSARIPYWKWRDSLVSTETDKLAGAILAVDRQYSSISWRVTFLYLVESSFSIPPRPLCPIANELHEVHEIINQSPWWNEFCFPSHHNIAIQQSKCNWQILSLKSMLRVICLAMWNSKQMLDVFHTLLVSHMVFYRSVKYESFDTLQASFRYTQGLGILLNARF